MIDPDHLTKYDRTTAELQELALFCILVAGKQAWQTARKLNGFLTSIAATHQSTPFSYIRWLVDQNILHAALVGNRFGQYARTGRAIKALTDDHHLDLTRVSVGDLTKIIGPKSARLFILHSRPGLRVAALDTHILKFLKERTSDCRSRAFQCMRDLGIRRIPKSTPTWGRSYMRLESLFLFICAIDRRDVAEYDLEIWKRYRTPQKAEPCSTI